MADLPEWGTVNLGVDVLQGHGEQSQPGMWDFESEHPHSKGKQQYNPGRNQELNLPPDAFPTQKGKRINPNSSTGKVVPFPGIHERIKELLGEGWPKRDAVAKAYKEAHQNDMGDEGRPNTKEIMAKKYQAEQPAKKISPFSESVQGYPFI